MPDSVTSPARGIGRRALVLGIAGVLVAQAATVYVVYEMTSARAGATRSASRPPAALLPGQAEGLARRLAAARNPGPAAPAEGNGAAAGNPPPQGVPAFVSRPPARSPWSDRPLDEAGRKLAADLSCPADDLRLLADEHGRVTDAARRDLMAGRDAGLRIAEDLGIQDGRGDEIAQILVGFMVRRVTLRQTFQGKAVTPEAIDDAANNDALHMAANNFDDRAKDAVAAALPGLPDLTADLPPPAP
jgi:hypothetical protein